MHKRASAGLSLRLQSIMSKLSQGAVVCRLPDGLLAACSARSSPSKDQDRGAYLGPGALGRGRAPMQQNCLCRRTMRSQSKLAPSLAPCRRTARAMGWLRGVTCCEDILITPGRHGSTPLGITASWQVLHPLVAHVCVFASESDLISTMGTDAGNSKARTTWSWFVVLMRSTPKARRIAATLFLQGGRWLGYYAKCMSDGCGAASRCLSTCMLAWFAPDVDQPPALLRRPPPACKPRGCVLDDMRPHGWHLRHQERHCLVKGPACAAAVVCKAVSCLG